MIFKDSYLKSIFDFGEKMENRLYSTKELEDAISETKEKLEEYIYDNKIIELNHSLGDNSVLDRERVEIYNPDNEKCKEIDIPSQITKNGKSYLKELLRKIHIQEPSKEDIDNYNLYLKALYFVFFLKFYIPGGAKYLNIFSLDKDLISFNILANPNNSKYIRYIIYNFSDEFNGEKVLFEKYDFTETYVIGLEVQRIIADIIFSKKNDTHVMLENGEIDEFLYGTKKGSINYYINLFVLSAGEVYFKNSLDLNNYSHSNILYNAVNKMINQALDAKLADVFNAFYDVRRQKTDSCKNALLRLYEKNVVGKIEFCRADIERTLYSDELLNICFPHLSSRRERKKKMKTYKILDVFKNITNDKAMMEVIAERLYLLYSDSSRNSFFSFYRRKLYIDKASFYYFICITTAISEEFEYESLSYDIENKEKRKKKKHLVLDLWKKAKKEETDTNSNSMAPIVYIIIIFSTLIDIFDLYDHEEYKKYVDYFNNKYKKHKEIVIELLKLSLNDKDGMEKRVRIALVVLKKLKKDYDIDLSYYGLTEEFISLFENKKIY